MSDLITAAPGVVALPPLPIELGSVSAIVARVPRTLGIHGAGLSAFASDTVRSCGKTSASLAENPPFVLISGCSFVELSAETNPPGQPVEWSIEPNPASGSPLPTLSPGGVARTALLHSDSVGTFALKARRGKTVVVLNVVFVWVKVDPAAATMVLRDSGYDDGGSNADFVNVTSGDIAPKQYAVEITVPRVEVLGGGPARNIGVSRTHLGVLQNATEVTLRATYADGATTREVPHWLPIRDSSKGGNPLLSAEGAVALTPPNDKLGDASVLRTVFTGDAPTTSFRVLHPATKAPLRKIDGHMAFRTALVSFSTDAASSLVVHAEFEWRAVVDGDVVHDAAGARYVPGKSARTTSTSLKLVEFGWRRGIDAGTQGYETRAPNYNSGIPGGYRRVSKPAASSFDPDDPGGK